MINVRVFVNSKGRYTGISMSGHAGYAKNHQEGQELVCAAASALALNMVNSVERFTRDRFIVRMEEKKGVFRFRFRNRISTKASLLMNSLVFGLLNIEKDYGKPYIKIGFKEV